MNTHEAAQAAGCDSPNDPNSEGTKWLRSCIDEAEEMKSELRDSDHRPGDLASEIADGLVPVYTHHLWTVWVELGGYNFDGEYRDFSSHGDSGDSMNRIAQADCFEWASKIVHSIAGRY